MNELPVVISTVVQYCPCGHIENKDVVVDCYLKRIDSSKIDAITRHSKECPECKEQDLLRAKLYQLYASWE